MGVRTSPLYVHDQLSAIVQSFKLIGMCDRPTVNSKVLHTFAEWFRCPHTL